MDEILVNNFMVFHDVVEETPYDLVIGDEAWDVDYFLHENPELKRFAFAWMTDFVGWLPMPDGGEREAALTADYNAEMIEQRARFRRVRDRSVFVGDPDDIVPDDLGPDLPLVRDWTEDNFEFAGYVTGFDPVTDAERTDAAVRARLPRGRAGLRGHRRRLRGGRVAVAAGPGRGSSGAAGRRRTAFPRRHRPAHRPGGRCPARGRRVRGYVPDLYRHLAACDLAVAQGGLTTCMELTASRRPFIYVPLRHHFEQNTHVRHRLERYGAGRARLRQGPDPDVLAAAIADELDRKVDYRPVGPTAPPAPRPCSPTWSDRPVITRSWLRSRLFFPLSSLRSRAARADLRLRGLSRSRGCPA